MVHNHGTEEGSGLICNEFRLPDGSLKGACLMPEEIHIPKTRPPLHFDEYDMYVLNRED